jgi:hypothetical protein
MHTNAALFTANKTHVNVSINSVARLPCIYVRHLFFRALSCIRGPRQKSLLKILVLKLLWLRVVTENYIGG